MLSLSVLLCLPLCVARPSPKFFSGDDKAKYAGCALDVWAAVDALGLASLSINSAVTDCKGDKTDQMKTACAGSVSGVNGAFFDVASFLSAAASDCAKDLNNKAYCASDVVAVLSSLANIAGSAAGMHSTCDRSKVSNRVVMGEDFGARRLEEFQASLHAESSDTSTVFAKLPAEPVIAAYRKQMDDFNKTVRELTNEASIAAIKYKAAKKVNDTLIAQCVFDVSMATQFLGRAALAINVAAKDCTPYNIKVNGNVGQKVCTVDVSGVINSFVSVGQFLSTVGVKCALDSSNAPQAGCSNAAFNAVAAIEGVVGTGASLPLTCGGQGEDYNYDDFILP
mmetsp:Transcript_84545/g.149724  ORF Transcript_84545/g.149724 Transcript_84545/m.149724 type:complete len:338 (+) Transcript_84545:37-1050(+)